TEVTLRPAVCNRSITSDQLDPSANSPCTSTTLRAFGGAAFAAMPPVEISEAAAPATRAVEKVRLFIIVMSLPFLRSAYERRRGRGEPAFDTGPRPPQARNPRPGARVTWRSMGRHTTSLNQCSLSARSCERMTEAHQHALSGCQGDCPLRHGRPVHDQTDAGI